MTVPSFSWINRPRGQGASSGQPRHVWLSVLCGLALVGAAPPAALEAADPVTLWDMVHRPPHDGISFVDAEDQGPEAARFLLPMLADPAEEEWWHNAIMVLGISGNSDVTDPLIGFFERWRSGEVSEATFKAITSVPAALAFVAAKGDDRALNYLLDCTRLSFYQDKGIEWVGLGLTSEQVHVYLVQMAVHGLSYSGRPEALGRLRDLETFPESNALGSMLRADLRIAIETHQSIAAVGARRHFGQ